MTYIELPITTDPDVLSASAFDELMAAIPGWRPQEGHLEVWLIEVLARMEAETRDVASRIPPTIFRYFGKSLMGIPAIDAARARVETTWGVVNASGYTIPAGTVVSYPVSGDRQVYFEVETEVVIPPGSTVTADGEVVLIALEAGDEANGLTGSSFMLVDALAFVAGIESEGVSAGGADAESDEEYLARLRDELKLLTPRPIRPDDFSTLAKRIAGVDRAVTIDGYNPSNGTYNNERMVAVALADEDGNAVLTPVKTAVATYLESLREVNFVVNVIDPTYTTIDVTATVKKLPSATTQVVGEAAVAAVKGDWKPVVRYNELISLLDRVEGVDYVETLQTPGSNVILPGVAALVKAGTVSITVLE
jgi:Baseplate J-like protein